jgi:3-oxoadipate enol-lactonase
MPQAELEDVRLHFEVEGDPDLPLLVLSNSLGSDLSLWNNVLPALGSRFRLLRYDTRGHGLSSVPPGPWTIEMLARDVLSLLDHLGVRHCLFCGISVGGMTGMWLGIHARDRIDKLVLVNTAAKIGTEESWNERIRRVETDGVESIASATVGRWLTQEFRRTHPAQAEVMRAMLVGTPAAGYARCAAAIRDADLTGDLPRIAAPTLIVAGNHDPAIPIEDAHRVHE